MTPDHSNIFGDSARREMHVHGMLACALSLAVAGATFAGSSVSYRLTALTGQPAPGTEEGVNFWVFTTPLNHDLMHPVIDHAGHVAFTALLTGPGVNASNLFGIWIESDKELTLAVRSGTHAPGTPDGVMFNAFPNSEITMPPSIGGGRVGFVAELSGPGIDFSNGSGVWKQQDDQLILVARNGDQAPGTPTNVKFSNIFIEGMADDAAVTLVGSVIGPGVNANNDDGIWSDRSGALTLVVRDGDAAPGTAPGIVFGGGVFGTGGYTFPLVVSNGSSQIAIKANLLGPVNAFNDEGVWVETSGSLALLAREGDHAPGTPGNIVFGSASGVSGFDQLSINSTGHVAFISRLTPPFHLGLWTNRNGELELIARTGQPAPGSGIVFTSFFGPLLDQAGKIAFMGAGDSVAGIWTDRDGPMTTVVQQGQQVENQPLGVTFTNSGINTFQLRAFNESGVMAFSAGVNDPKQGSKTGLLLNDPKLGTHLVAATGDTFDVLGDGSDLRTIERIVYGGLSADGQVAFRLDFTDQSSAHYAASIATVQPCLTDISGDGVVNVSDLLAVINAWGPCAPGLCAADVNSDGIVNAGDLLAVINAWGPCS